MPPQETNNSKNGLAKFSGLKSGFKNPSQFSHSQLGVFVLAFGLIGYFLFRTFAAAPVVATLEAEQMSLPAGGSVITDSVASAGKAIKLTANGASIGSVNFPSSVTSLTVIARGDQCSGAPTMNVSLDGAALLSNTAIASTSWAAYTITPPAAINSGTHSLSVSFTNAYTDPGKVHGNSGKSTGGCSRNLFADVTNFYGPTPPPTAGPTITLSASPLSVTAGQSSTLTWNSANATSCIASGAWSGTQPVSGSVSTGALNQSSTYSLTCTGTGGSTTTSVTVTVSGSSVIMGSNTPGSSWSSMTGDYLRGTRYSLSTSGTLSSISAYIDGLGAASGSQTIQYLIYSVDGNGNPANLVAQTAAATINAGAAAKWVALNTSSPVSLAAGNYYMSIFSGQSEGIARFSYGATGPSVFGPAYTFTAGPPSAWGTPAGTNNIQDAIYAVVSTSGTTPPPPVTSVGNGLAIIEEGGQLSLASNPGQYGMVVVSNTASDVAAACALPKSTTRSLVYMDFVSINKNYNTGVDWNTANANGWFLKDSSGNLLYNAGFPSNNIGDIGNTSYQQAWLNNVTNFLSANHCSGVFIDDIQRHETAVTNAYAAKYPDDTSWDNATVGFLKNVTATLKSRGYYVLLNASAYTPGDGNSDNGVLESQWWQQVGPYVNGLTNEFWQQTAEGSYTSRLSGSDSWMKFWDGWQAIIGTAQAMGDDFVGLTYENSNNYAAQRYTRGSFLLEWNGGGSAYMFDPLDSVDPYNSVWTYNIGKPAAAKTQPVSGVWQRSYTNGKVIVNPTGSTVTVSGHTIGSGDAYIGP